jgi:3-hydroxyacyl-CoA dehydrogenase/enoyl-CoA hydratase/3-hydroxybutyryl-CoA epimerase
MTTRIDAAGAAPRVALAPARVVLTHDDGIATLRLGGPEEAVVTITSARLDAIAQALDDVEALAAAGTVRGLIVTGPGPGMFCAGADLALIQGVRTAAEGAAAATRGRAVFARCSTLRVPVVAAIEGPCLGGGLELALWCDARIASEHAATQLGLPEVKLGILPGFGGTWTLPRLVGLPQALDLVLRGRTLRALQAKKAGVVDRVAPSCRLLQVARERCERLAAAGRHATPRALRGLSWWTSRTPLRAFVAARAAKDLRTGPARFLPAPAAALQSCVRAFTRPIAEHAAAEAQALGELVVTPACRGLVHLFVLGERKKRLGRGAGAADCTRAVVVGGGVMGAGIASLLAEKGTWTRLVDVDLAPLTRAKARLQQTLQQKARRGQLAAHEVTAAQDRLAVGTDAGQLTTTDLWLEAVVEDLGQKQRLLADAVARGLPATAVAATNTSSLSISAMADAVPNPERVVGIHFFNPPEKMPLVEVIRGKATNDATVATACRLALRLGKVPVVVADAPGFLVNRCLAPYVNEAARLLLEGTSVQAIDAAMLDFGMPMGPCRLLDEIGFDVAAKVSAVMHAAFPDRMQPCELFAAMSNAKVLGRKSGGGLYGKDGAGPGPGRAIVAMLRACSGVPSRAASRSELVQRLIYPLVDEAYRCLDAGVALDEGDLDLALVLGIGFPPHTGGVTQYAAREGLRTITAALDALARTAPRFTPGDGLRRRALAVAP